MRGQAHFAGTQRPTAAADQRDDGGAVVRRPQGRAGDQNALGQRGAGRRVDAGDVHRLLRAQIREQSGQAFGQHGLARTGRAHHEQVMGARGGHLERSDARGPDPGRRPGRVPVPGRRSRSVVVAAARARSPAPAGSASALRGCRHRGPLTRGQARLPAGLPRARPPCAVSRRRPARRRRARGAARRSDPTRRRRRGRRRYRAGAGRWPGGVRRRWPDRGRRHPCARRREPG